LESSGGFCSNVGWQKARTCRVVIAWGVLPYGQLDAQSKLPLGGGDASFGFQIE